MRTTIHVLHGLLMTLVLTFVHAQDPIPVNTDWSAPVVLDTTPSTSHLAIDSNSDGVIGVTWSSYHPNTQNRFELYFSRSEDMGNSWSEPRRLVELNGLEANTWPSDFAMGDNGVWMIALTLRVVDPPQYPTYHGILMSYDSGATWSHLVDLTNKFSYPENNPASVRKISIAYAGNNTWIYSLSHIYESLYTRSTDNGQTWSSPVHIHRYVDDPPRLASSNNDNTVVINYREYNPVPGDPDRVQRGPRVSIFSNDSGQTFGPPVISSIAASDDNGNWVLADWLTTIDSSNQSFNVDGDFTIQYSTDRGNTFTELSDPPSIKAVYPNLRFFVIDSLAINNDGHIMLVGTAWVDIGWPFNFPQYGQMTRSTDLGQTWTPWEKLPHGLSVAPITVAQNVFVSLDKTLMEGYDHYILSARIFDPATVTSARDWQLYQ